MAADGQLDIMLEQEVDALVATGRYRTRLDVLREGVRLVREREVLAEIEAKIKVGIADADAGRTTPASEVFDRLTSKYAALSE